MDFSNVLRHKTRMRALTLVPDGYINLYHVMYSYISRAPAKLNHSEIQCRRLPVSSLQVMLSLIYNDPTKEKNINTNSFSVVRQKTSFTEGNFCT